MITAADVIILHVVTAADIIIRVLYYVHDWC